MKFVEEEVVERGLRCIIVTTNIDRGRHWLPPRRLARAKIASSPVVGRRRDFLSAGKKLLDTKHPAYKDVTAIRGRVSAFWKSLPLPYPEPGIRLIRQEHVESFDQQMSTFRTELMEAVARLDDRYAEFKSAAQRRLA